VLGVCADTPATLATFRERAALPFTLLSDPQLATAAALDSPTATKANLWATAALHRVVLGYPKKSFLQPALFVWRKDGTLAHSWRQTESGLTNFYGARGRPTAEQVLDVVKGVIAAGPSPRDA
jgi:peroxiredoxin